MLRLSSGIICHTIIIIIIITIIIASHEDGMNDIYNDKNIHVMK